MGICRTKNGRFAKCSSRNRATSHTRPTMDDETVHVSERHIPWEWRGLDGVVRLWTSAIDPDVKGKTIPIYTLGGTAAQARRAVIAYNRAAYAGDWNYEAVSEKSELIPRDAMFGDAAIARWKAQRESGRHYAGRRARRK